MHIKPELRRRVIMAGMTDAPIWMAAAQPASAAKPGPAGGCGLCHTPLGAAACRPALARTRCTAPRLVGPAPALERVLDVLRQVQDPECGGNIVDGGLIEALELRADEATLTLVAGTGGCAIGSLIAEDAFLALRAALPNTDVYVQHDRTNPWRHVFGPDAAAPLPA